MQLPTKALSVRQPWAWAIIHAGKDVENRSWQAVARGRFDPRAVCIHAAKGMTRDEYESAAGFMASLKVECPRPDDLIRGAIIGGVWITDIVRKHDSPWFFGPRGLVLHTPVAVEPIPASGARGFFDWQRSGEIAEPLPWMKAWPDDHKRNLRPVTASLFDQKDRRT